MDEEEDREYTEAEWKEIEKQKRNKFQEEIRISAEKRKINPADAVDLTCEIISFFVGNFSCDSDEILQMVDQIREITGT